MTKLLINLLQNLQLIPAALAFQPIRHTTFGTSGGETFARVSDIWLLEFYFKE